MVTNGKIPSGSLERAYRSLLFLAPGCNAAWSHFAKDVHEQTGIWPKITSPDGAYRSYARQVYWYGIFQRYGHPVAAYPGTSNHGLGMAIDIANYASFSHAFLVKIGSRYGFTFDTPSERWHMRFIGSADYKKNVGSVRKDKMMYPYTITDIKGKPKFVFDVAKSKFIPVPEGSGGQIEAAFGKFIPISSSTMNLIKQMVA